MPAEIPFPGAGDPSVGLIETFRWTRAGGYDLLPEHMGRLERSAACCGFKVEMAAVRARLAEAAGAFQGDWQRVRFVAFPDGTHTLTATALDPAPPRPFRVALAGAHHQADDPWLRHKTTARDRYERPLAEATATRGADEVLFVNERGEVCEGARTNLFVSREGGLLTPPLRCGLLPGTLRAHLLATGRACEAVIPLSDLGPGTEWFLGNSVRGLVPATWVADPR